MKIGFKCQPELVRQVATTLAHSEFPRSWNLVMPPGFADQSALAEELRETIRVIHPGLRIAILSADAVSDRSSYARRLEEDWAVAIPESIHGDARLEFLLGQLKSHQPGIQIVIRFEKILSRMDGSILGLLRDVERAHGLRTVTMSTYPYHELRERWRSESHPFCTSDYGDTHECRTLEPLSVNEILPHSSAVQIPEDVARFLFSLTGGYPNPSNNVVGKWLSDGRPSFTASYREQLRDYVSNMFLRLLDWLDRKDVVFFRKHLANFYVGTEPETAHAALMPHPWYNILLSEGKLRSECLGRLALDREIKLSSSDSVGWKKLVQLYQLGSYASISRILGGSINRFSPIHLQILLTHSQLMDLMDAMAPEHGVDLNYPELECSLAVAKTTVVSNSSRLPDADMLIERYDRLAQFVAAVIQARRQGMSTLDALVKNGTQTSIQTALVLLLSQVEAARRIPGNTVAFQVALPLPEQALRLWALLRVKLDFYSAPITLDRVALQMATTEWEKLDSRPFMKFDPGKKFPCVPVFAFYSLACHLAANGNPENAPETSFQNLFSSLELMGARNSAAHSLAFIPANKRLMYFEVLDRWTHQVFLCCPGVTSPRQLLSVIEPLPIVDEQGMFLPPQA